MSVLVVNRSDSYCAECKNNGYPAGTLAHSTSHDLVYGYFEGSGTQPGCKAVYTKIRSDYFGLRMDEWAAENRPDLEWVGTDEKAMREEWKNN